MAVDSRDLLWESKNGKIIAQLEAARTSRVLCCVTSDRPGADGAIAKDFIPIFFDHLRAFGSDSKRIDVFMFTTGGDTLASFVLSRLVRTFTRPGGRFAVLVPEKCKAAALSSSLARTR